MSGLTARRAILAVLALQCGLAGVLVVPPLASAIAALAPSRAPEITTPVAPGDQRRRYRPERLGPAPDRQRPFAFPDEMPDRLRFEAAEVDGRRALSLTGAIAPGDADRFETQLRLSAVPPEVVFLNSPGGSVADALAIGRALRRDGLAAAMSDGDICLSACPYVLAGGLTRDIPDGAAVGVHQHSFGESVVLPAFLAVEDIQRGQAEVLSHLDEMGIDLRVMGPALATPADEIYVLLPEELVDWGFVDVDTES